jgi:hypothetical protein
LVPINFALFARQLSVVFSIRRLTQRYEASLWLRRRQVYLGGYNSEEDAARAYDVAALLFKGRTSPTNFPVECYEDQLTQLDGESKASHPYNFLLTPS